MGTLSVGNNLSSTAKGVSGGANEDDDHGGLTNNRKYALGLLPTSGSSVNPTAVPLSTTTGTFSYTRQNSALTVPLAFPFFLGHG